MKRFEFNNLIFQCKKKNKKFYLHFELVAEGL